MAQITITIDSLFVERLIYYLLIVALIIVAIIGWTRDCPGEEQAGVAVHVAGNGSDVALAAGGANTSGSASDSTSVEALCSNGVKDGDEVNVDCGGRCSEMNGAFFYEGACHASLPSKDVMGGEKNESGGAANESAEVTPGKRVFAITGVDFEINPTTGKIKILSLDVDIKNGEEKMEGLEGEVYIHDDRGRLDDWHTILESDPLRPYDVLKFRTIGEGEHFSGTLFIDNPVTLFSVNDEAPFSVEVEFFLDDKKIGSASKEVDPT
ncbi:hypothetical protein D6783_05525 [Candidatus Woesearchaeota archaeon]|nr:MAG: hypothetical protein D6783_05525 [Candidatus Woesearchaeota archaeon]